jgi:chitinase
VVTPPPTTFSVAAAPATLVEGNSGTKVATFTVTLVAGTPAPVYPVQVSYATVAGTATANADFTPASGTLSFARGETTKTVTVPVIGDTTPEFDETLKLVLSSPTGGSVVSTTAGEAIVTITSDDGYPQPPTIGFKATAVSVTEGAAGAKTPVSLTVRLLKAEAVPVTVRYTALNGTAAAGSDFIAATGLVTIPAGLTEKSFELMVVGDAVAETDETFSVRLTDATASATIDAATATITIRNDDGELGPPPLRVSNASVVEGNRGTPLLRFTITLSRASKTDTILTYSTVGITAVAGRDYRETTGTVKILAGRTTATVTVPVIPNPTVDGNRTLKLRVKSGLTLAGVGVGTIVDDDKAFMKAAFASLASAAPSTPTFTKKKS